MAISNQAAINKMISELQQALNSSPSDEKAREHIRAVRLLCDLMLEEEPASSQVSSDQELQKMIGGLESSLNKEKTQQNRTSAPSDYEEGNGDSIFDF